MGQEQVSAVRWALAVAGLGLAIDQAAKAILPTIAHPMFDPQINPDLALGWAGGSSGLLSLAMIVVLVVVVGAGVVGFRRARWPAWPVALVASGAASNLIDRLLHDGVRDAMVVGPVVANVADILLLIGVISWVATAHPPMKGNRHERQTA